MQAASSASSVNQVISMASKQRDKDGSEGARRECAARSTSARGDIRRIEGVRGRTRIAVPEEARTAGGRRWNDQDYQGGSDELLVLDRGGEGGEGGEVHHPTFKCTTGGLGGRSGRRE